MLTAESCDVSKPTLQFLEKRCTFAVSMCVILPTWLRDVATTKKANWLRLRQINIPFFDADGKVLNCHKSRCGCTLFRMDDELHHIQKPDAVATDEIMPLWSMDVCKAFRVAPLLIQQDSCDVLKINPPFFDADEKVLDCYKNRCGCTFFRMDDELPHIPKTRCGCRLSAKAMRSHCFFLMSADACRPPTDCPRPTAPIGR